MVYKLYCSIKILDCFCMHICASVIHNSFLSPLLLYNSIASVYLNRKSFNLSQSKAFTVRWRQISRSSNSIWLLLTALLLYQFQHSVLKLGAFLSRATYFVSEYGEGPQEMTQNQVLRRY